MHNSAAMMAKYNKIIKNSEANCRHSKEIDSNNSSEHLRLHREVIYMPPKWLFLLCVMLKAWQIDYFERSLRKSTLLAETEIDRSCRHQSSGSLANRKPGCNTQRLSGFGWHDSCRCLRMVSESGVATK